MNTAMQPFDSRAMPLAEPSTAPSALSWWRWFGRRRAGKTAATEAAREPAGAPDASSRACGDSRAAADPEDRSSAG